jgi:hypothetical protein
MGAPAGAMSSPFSSINSLEESIEVDQKYCGLPIWEGRKKTLEDREKRQREELRKEVMSEVAVEIKTIEVGKKFTIKEYIKLCEKFNVDSDNDDLSSLPFTLDGQNYKVIKL